MSELMLGRVLSPEEEQRAVFLPEVHLQRQGSWQSVQSLLIAVTIVSRAITTSCIAGTNKIISQYYDNDNFSTHEHVKWLWHNDCVEIGWPFL